MKSLGVVVVMVMATSASADRVSLLADAAARSNAGDHAGAIALYERAYATQPDPSLLPILGAEYRRAGLSETAMTHFCEYLAVQPKGAQATFAAAQVVAIRAELGLPVAKPDVCAKPQPVRIDFVTPRRSGPARSKREMAGIATAAVGLAALGASLYYNGRAAAVADDIANHPAHEPWPDNINELESRGQRFEDRAQWFAIAGGAALVTAGVLYFTGRASRDEVVVAPTMSSSGGGISLTRGF